MNHEEFARQRAADGWSQQNVADALGLSKYKLRLWLEHIEPIQWPKPWESKNAKAAVERLNESRQGTYPLQFQRTAEVARKTRRANLLTRAFGETATVSEFAEKYGVRSKTLRKRLAKGHSLEEALTLKQVERGRLYTAFGRTAPLKELVAEFGVITQTSVVDRMSKGMPPEEALTMPRQDVIIAYSRKTNHPWRRADDARYQEFVSKRETRFSRQQEACI